MATSRASLPARLRLSLLVLSLAATVAPAVAGGAAGSATSPAAAGAPPGDALAQRGRLEEAIDEARWKMGRVYLEPWFGVRDVSSIDTSRGEGRGEGGGEPPSDVSVTVGAGLRAYLPVGGEAIWAAHALPEYVYWRDLAGRRSLAGRYGVGFFGSLGGLDMEASLGRVDDSRVFSRELEEKVDSTAESVALGLELPLAGGFSLFGVGTVRELAFDRPDADLPPIDVLQRREEVARGGVGWEPAPGALLRVGVERSAIDFDDPASLRSSRDTSPFLELSWATPRLLLAADVVHRSLEPTDGPDHLAYDRPAGSLRALARFGPLELEATGSRRLVYSFRDRWAWFEDSGVELAAAVSFGSSASLRLALEDGRNRYFPFDPAAPDALRRDDYQGIAGTLRLRIDRVTLVLGVAETEYDSNLPGADRTVTSIRSALVFGERSSSPWS